MKTYKVSEVAELLNVNSETVRRWIRSGRLVADRHFGPSGNTIARNAIESFLDEPENKQYATNFVRAELMSARENDEADNVNLISDELDQNLQTEFKEESTEPVEQLDTASKEALKSTLMSLIAMRDNLNHQIDELIKLL